MQTVPDLLSIVTAVYEALLILFTTVPAVQTLNIGESWREHQKSSTFEKVCVTVY